MGKVILVGAGAGDTGLLTIKGKKYIEEADLHRRNCLEWQIMAVSAFM